MLRGKLVNLRPVEREDLKKLQELERNVDLVILATGTGRLSRWRTGNVTSTKVLIATRSTGS